MVEYLGVTLNKIVTWASHLDQVRLGVLGPFLNRLSGLSIRNGLTLYKQLMLPKWITLAQLRGMLPTTTSGGSKFFSSNACV